MVEFLTNYWFEFVLGLAAASFTWFIKNYYKLKSRTDDEDKEDLKKEIVDEFGNKISQIIELAKEGDAKVKEDIINLDKDISNIKTGLLSVQGREFREQCVELLDKDHEITVEEYEQFEEDYAAYKALDGNHRGDALHAAVENKFQIQTTSKGNAE